MAWLKGKPQSHDGLKQRLRGIDTNKMEARTRISTTVPSNAPVGPNPSHVVQAGVRLLLLAGVNRTKMPNFPKSRDVRPGAGKAATGRKPQGCQTHDVDEPACNIACPTCQKCRAFEDSALAEMGNEKMPPRGGLSSAYIQYS